MAKFSKFMKVGFSLLLSVAMVASNVTPAMAAQTDPTASAEREATNAKISEDAATQGMVLLDNQNGVLPISAEKGTKVALFGEGVYHTVKGGTGSGDVYLRDGVNINVLTGFKKAGYDVVNEEFVAEREKEYIDGSAAAGGGGMFGVGYVHDEPKYNTTEIAEIAAKTDTAIYVITRNSGEGGDRTADKGDYFITDNEKANLTTLGAKFDKVIVVLNVGGVVDTNFYHGKLGAPASDELNRSKIEGLDALLLMSQAGQNGGNAVVRVLNGDVNPSGKLTDTWAIDYWDYPSSTGFSFNDMIEADSAFEGSVAHGNSNEEAYTDDIYVGYRYFDTFGKEVAYPFGYGESYTTFETTVDSVLVTGEYVNVNATVKNTGKVTGKEVVEVYFSAPAGSIDKPFQELAGYEKVEVAPGDSKKVTVSYKITDMSSYNEATNQYEMEAGTYTVRVGNSSRNTIVGGTIVLDRKMVTEICENQLGLTKASMKAGTYDANHVMPEGYYYKETTNQWGGKSISVVYPEDAKHVAYKMDMLDASSKGYGTGITPSAEGLSVAKKIASSIKAESFKAKKYNYTNGEITTYVSDNKETDSAKYGEGTAKDKETFKTVEAPKTEEGKKATLLDVVEGKATYEQLVADMSNVELADLVEGGSYAGLAAGDNTSAVIGSQAESVPGAAGETTSNLFVNRNIPNIVLSDGPAGIRISITSQEDKLVSILDTFDENQKYYRKISGWGGVNYKEVEITDQTSFEEAIKTDKLYTLTGETVYQYCTAFPIGTMLAQTWDRDVIEAVGRAVGVEMLEYGVASWLAPGMNIHRNPLCGRNFEYYSEDPLVCGITAAAETRGVETDEKGNKTGVGVTLKHFAFNNQEEERMGSNSVVSERAAREIYLKGFEIAVRDAQPDYIMSSYNQVNGISTFQNYGLLTELLVNEWGFNGFVMTDWYSINGVNAGSVNYGKNVQSLLMWAGNDCEMPGGSESKILKGLEDGSLRLGDLQRSAIHMLEVIKDTPAFVAMADKLGVKVTPVDAPSRENFTYTDANKAPAGGNIVYVPTTDTKPEEKPEEKPATTAPSATVVAVTEKDGAFVNAAGEKVTNAMVKAEDGKTYILDAEGAKITNAVVKTASGTKFVTAKDGAVVKGKLVTVNGKKFYTTKATGKVVTGKTFKVNGKKYIAAKSGALYTSKWVKIGNKKYYCNKSGVVTKSKKVK